MNTANTNTSVGNKWQDEVKIVESVLNGLGLTEVDLPHQHIDFPINLDDISNAELGNLLVRLGALRGRQTWLIAQVQMKVKCIEAEHDQKLWGVVSLLEINAAKKRLKDAMVAEAYETDKYLFQLRTDLVRHKVLMETLVKTFELFDDLFSTVSRAITVREMMQRGGV